MFTLSRMQDGTTPMIFACVRLENYLPLSPTLAHTCLTGWNDALTLRVQKQPHGHDQVAIRSQHVVYD